MIFVTVGTTLPFDSLIEKIDRLKCAGILREEVICQIGNGTFEPRCCQFFRFRPSVDDLIERASLVIGHGGTGTTLGLLEAGKRFIAVANPIAADSHQEQFLEKLSQYADLLWTKDLSRLEDLVAEASASTQAKLELPSLADHLRTFIDSR